MEHIAVTHFREYLQINSQHPHPDYAACRDFLFKYADEIGIMKQAVETAPGVFFVIMTILGSLPTLPSIMLYSHTDVVPVTRANWIHDPYSGFKDSNGTIYGRGSQDVKIIGVQHLEAFRNLFSQGINQWKRTIHIVFGPDEETGGINGMRGFVKTEEFKKLNIGFMLDEGVPSEDSVYNVYYGEKVAWHVNVTIPGRAGHGSKFVENTALEKLERLLDKTRAFRNAQQRRLKTNSNLTLGDVTTLNVNIIKGGVLVNVVPERFDILIDIRLTPLQDFDEMHVLLDRWMKYAGEGVSYKFLQYSDFKPISPNTRSDKFWAAFEDGMNEEKCKFKPGIVQGSGDSRFLRKIGIPAINFSPMINTQFLLHDDNEHVHEKIFMKGIKIYESLINKLANVE